MRSNYLARVALLAALYMLTGKLGLLLAVPPGYATIIWPASGIAVGMLIMNARLWPGVLLGSFLLNSYNSGVFADTDWYTTKTLAAFLIACGSTLQALTGRALIARVIGLPLKLKSGRQLTWLLGIAGPLTCVIAATIGVGTLYSLGIVGRADVIPNWLAWWSGDTLGVLVFMPLALLAPGSRAELTWRGAALGRLPLAGLLLLLLPLGLTFYAWKATTENDYQRGQAKFQTLTIESEKALQSRLASYGNALLGAAAFVQGSVSVSRDEWRTYVRTIQVRENFAGLHGLGWLEPVADEDVDEFLRETRVDGAPNFSIHPEVGGPRYVIKYVEPEGDNRAALGLNIAFEEKRLAAANQARDSGQVTLSGRITLVQDAQRSPGFLLFYPIYHGERMPGSVEGRRAAIRGWTYAPFVAHSSLDSITHSQGDEFRLRIYDGTNENPDELIYSTDTSEAKSAFQARSTLEIMQRKWLLVWESTPAFELTERSANPLFILVGGILFTALLALLLIVIAVRRTEHIEQMVGERRFAVPLLVFLVIGAASFAMYSKLRSQELIFVLRQVQDEASKVGSLLRSQANERVTSLARMAARWESAGGTDYELWRRDAANHVAQLPGLRALEWIDSTYHVRWAEPLAGNENVIGLDVLYDQQRAVALRGAADRQRATLTPPLKLIQGYNAFIAYLPLLSKQGQFDGFIAGVFSIEEFFHGAMRTELSRNYSMSILHNGFVYFTDAGDDHPAPASWVTETSMRIQDQTWTLRIAPTSAFVESQKSELPALALAAGLLVAALSALSVRYILISRLKSAHLSKSLALNTGIISSSAHLVIAIDEQYRIVNFNRAAEQALGYRAAEVIERRAIPLFLDPGELEERAHTLSAELGESVPVGPTIFTRLPLRDGFESREWTFVRKDGSRFPANVTITPLRDESGVLTGFLGVIEDITVRKDIERMKSEFTAVVSHELRTPLTSIRGSLGLILGALQWTLQPKVKSLIEIAQSNCERLVLLVNDILDIEKFAAGQMRFEFQTLSLTDIVKKAVDANEGYARKYQVQFDIDPVEPDLAVLVDPDRFIQVMSNLLSNAAKYSPQGGTVRVRAERRDEFVRISVRDEGPGIPESFRGRIFEKFTQADSSSTREKGGTGLGLHIAKRFVEHMRGRIGFDSEFGRGSTFWVELPLAAQAAVAGTAA